MAQKDMDFLEKKLGQILLNNDKVNKKDLESSLAVQNKSDGHKLLGGILVELNMISKEDLVSALNTQMQSSEYEKDFELNPNDDERISRIANKYKESEYSKDLYELISVITHKIRNPLAGISAAVEVLKEKNVSNEKNDMFFKMIFKEVDRLESIVKDLFKTFSNK